MTLKDLLPGRMNSTKLLGFTLIALAIVTIGYQSLPDLTLGNTNGSVAQVPPAKTRSSWGLILGVVVLAAGIGVLVIDFTERSR